MSDIPNTLVRTIEKLSYPFLDDLPKDNEQAYQIYITEINEIAKSSYTKPGGNTPTMTYDQLSKVVELDPTAWLVCREKSLIQGFIHVQLISNMQADQLATGQIDENEIRPLRIDSSENKVIHIGSVVSRNYPNKISNKIPVRLIAGTIEKVVSLRQSVPSINRIITCEFEDKFGIRHFQNKLPNYGFVKIGKTIGGDTVWELDLEKNNRPFSSLITIVSAKKLSFLGKKQYLPLLKSAVPEFINTLKSINQTISELKKLKNEMIPDILTEHNEE